MGMGTLTDRYGRKHDYLRISVTDRCNLRCIYCMGPDGVKPLSHHDILSYEEILKVVRVAAGLGISKIRITGGEPLVRINLPHLIEKINSIPGIEDLALTTNGIFLPRFARELKRAGLNRVNISLDSLDPDLFRKITRGGNIKQALRGIEAAIHHGLEPVKINTVLLKGYNDHEILDFFALAHDKDIAVRFIEYMPIGERSVGFDGHYLPLSIIKETAQLAGYELQPLDHPLSAGPAEYFSLAGRGGSIGLIHSISKHFCSSCNRLRLTADGRLKSCLYWQEEEQVRPILDHPRELEALLKKVVLHKHKEHLMGSENSELPTMDTATMRTMSQTGG
ncbi:MAG: GTP 3',8-cyclase MoaA [Firmicutes bacterium]|nr:GTP 3',8-cyclase MoaA [Bacillota bacterium]